MGRLNCPRTLRDRLRLRIAEVPSEQSVAPYAALTGRRRRDTDQTVISARIGGPVILSVTSRKGIPLPTSLL
jgi:hypothetical protein